MANEFTASSTKKKLHPQKKNSKHFILEDNDPYIGFTLHKFHF